MKELRGWFGLTNQMQNYVPGLAGKQRKLRSLLNKGVTFWIDEEMREELEKTKQAISDNILLNNFCMKRATVVITDASGDGFAFILLQYTGGGYIVIQVGSAAIKKVWKSYSALELEGTCVIWSIESLKFYLKGLARFELWTDHSPLKDAMLKPMRDLSPRLQKFREAVEGYGMVLKHVRGATNLAADSMSRAPVGSSEEVEKVLNGIKSQGNRYVYNIIVSSVQGDISDEVLEDPALDDLWEAAEADEEYKLAAKVIADKVKMKEVMKMDKHPIKQFRKWAYRLSVIENKKGTRLMLLDATRLVVPEALREQLTIQAHVGHQGTNKMCMDVAAKYFWPHYKTTIAEVCASCASCQQHGRSQQAQPLRLALEHVTRPMTSVGLDLFTWKGGQHLVMVDHFSSMPFYSRMARTTAVAVAKQLEVWFNMFGAVRFVRADRGPPFSSAAFLGFCKSWNISLNLTTPYCPTSSGGAECSIGVLKEILKKVDTEGSCFETAFAAYKTTRTESGFSPAQLFFLRNVRTAKTPSLWQEPIVEEMVVARDRIRAARATKEEDRPGLAPLEVGDLVVGQHPKSCQWTMSGEVSTVTHGGRAYWVKFHEGGGRLFSRVDLKLDRSGNYGYTEQEMRQLEELWELHNPEIPENQPGDRGGRTLDLEKQRADSDRRTRRRSKRLLNRQGVSFMAGPEAERGQ